ncbi:hypothetical protein [Streptomyces sp. XY431]|uniref:hypothetical protein n=1 Tax=Streptomyces sp. XY431 TaxID=1415562 RepID=UPI0006AFE2DA|nr:hypothetical protein [Streptomyces sp. XY431]
MHEQSADVVLTHPLVRELLTLRLPPDDFVIFGSGPLLAHGLRTNLGDLDLVARGAAWGAVSRLGVRGSGGFTGDEVFRCCDGRINVFRRWISPAWDPDDLIDNAEVIGGLRFAPLTEVLAYKLILRRPKDLPDIRAIRRSLDQQRGPR